MSSSNKRSYYFIKKRIIASLIERESREEEQNESNDVSTDDVNDDQPYPNEDESGNEDYYEDDLEQCDINSNGENVSNSADSNDLQVSPTPDAGQSTTDDLINQHSIGNLSVGQHRTIRYFIHSTDPLVIHEKEILRRLLRIRTKSPTPISTMNEFLKILNFTSDVAQCESSVKLTLPVNYDQFMKKFGLDIDTFFGFSTKCCSINIIQQKDVNNRFRCTCGQEIKSTEVFRDKNYYFYYDFIRMIKLMIIKFGLVHPVFDDEVIKTEFDGAVFKNLYFNINGKFISATLFTDGVRLYKSTNDQLWPIFMRLNNVNCDEVDKIILIACWIGQGKPDQKVFFKKLVSDLNTLFNEGIEIDETKIYVAVTNIVFDLEAKFHFMSHCRHNADHGCCECFQAGSREEIIIDGEVKTTVHIYPPNQIALRRTMNVHKEILDKIKSSNLDQFFGVKDETILMEINYFEENLFNVIPPDPMHFLSGIIDKFLSTMIANKNSNLKCFIAKDKLSIFNKRIQMVPITNQFKSKPETIGLKELGSWKSSQFFEFLLYFSPVCASTLVNRRTYNNFFALAYIISKLWIGGLNRLELDDLDELIRKYLQDVETIFTKQHYTINQHQLKHLTDSFENHGPIGKTAAFPFESMNYELRKAVLSPHGILEQISRKFHLRFAEVILFNKKRETEIRKSGKIYKFNNRNCFAKIFINNKAFTSSYNTADDNQTSNYFVRTADGKCFKILYYFLCDSEYFFEGKEIVLDSKLAINYFGERLELDYVFKARLTDNLVTKSVEEITDKVFFVRKFEKESFLYEKGNAGLVVQLIHKFHN